MNRRKARPLLPGYRLLMLVEGFEVGGNQHTFLCSRIDEGNCMHKNEGDHETTDPTMHCIERAEVDTKGSNEWVPATSHNEERNCVDQR